MRVTGTLALDGSTLKLNQGGNATTIQSNSPGSSIAITLPNTACTLSGIDKAQTWSAAQTFNQNTLLINDDDASHSLSLLWNEAEASSNRTLNFIVNGGNRTLNLSANLTLTTGLTVNTGAMTLSPHASGNTLSFAASATHEVGGTGANAIATIDGTQTLTAKTLTAPKITANSTIDTPSLDDGTITIGGTNATGVLIGRSGQNTTIQGNLVVSGTTTTVNSTTITIDDPNIVLNDGQGGTGAGAGLTIDTAGTQGSLIYAPTTNSKWKAGELGSEVELVNLSTAQTIQNKTIDANASNANYNPLSGVKNASIHADAAIDRSKLATGTNSYVVTNHGSTGVMTEQQYLNISQGGTGQTSKTPAFDALSPTTTKGDLIVSDGTNNIRVAVGTNNNVLIADSAQTSGVKWGTAVAANPMTTTGDIIYSSDNSGTPARLGIGSTDQVLRVSGGVPTWATALASSTQAGFVNYYDTTSISGSLGGSWNGTAATYSADLVRVGKLVICTFYASTPTREKNGSNDVTLTIPAGFRPSTSSVGGTLLFSNVGNTRYIACWTLNTSGTFTIYNSLTAGDTMTNGLNIGFNEATHVSWVIN